MGPPSKNRLTNLHLKNLAIYLFQVFESTLQVPYLKHIISKIRHQSDNSNVYQHAGAFKNIWFCFNRAPRRSVHELVVLMTTRAAADNPFVYNYSIGRYMSAVKLACSKSEEGGNGQQGH